MHRPGVSYQFEDVILNPEAFTVEKSGRALALEPKSIRLLLYLIQNRTRAIGKDELIGKIWEDVAVTDNALARVVAQLRKALGDDVKVARYIETVPTIGYRFIAEVTEIAAPAAAPIPPAAARPAQHRARWPMAAALAVALIGIVTASVLWKRARAGPTRWSGTLLGGSIIASHPRISPDGNLLAFRAIIDGLSQVAIMKPDSSSWTALTHDRTNGAVASLAWSRDGSKIYFDREWGPGRVYSIGPLGGEARLVLENAWMPEPLPDGSIVAQRPSSGGRYQLIRFWPDSGRTQILPATTRFDDSPNVRVFADGREIAVFGLPASGAGEPRPFILNLQTLQTRDLQSDLKPEDMLRVPLAISADDRSVLVQRQHDDTLDTIQLPRSGYAAAQTLISLPGVASPISMDAAPDGSIYMDHSQFERSILNIGSSGTVNEVPIPELAEGGGVPSALIALPGGAVAINVRRRGSWEVYIVRNGGEPQLLLNTPESAYLPGALVGAESLAFILGPWSDPHIALASLHDGTVIRRYPGDGRLVTSMTAPADGQTIYYAANGTIWAQPVSGGEPRKIGAGHDVAIDPAGKVLYVIRTSPEGNQLFRMSADGGEATRVILPAGFNLTPMALSPSAVDRKGRVLLPVNVPDVFFFRAGLFDTATGGMKLIAMPPRVVVGGAGWTPEGDMAAGAVRWSSSLWRYRRSF